MRSLFFIGRRSVKDPVAPIIRVRDEGVPDTEFGLFIIKAILGHKVAQVLGRLHPAIKGSLGRGMARHDRLDLIGILESGPLQGQLIAGSGDIPIRSVPVRVNMIEVATSSHVAGPVSGTFRQSRIPIDSCPGLSRVSAYQSCHFFFAFRTAIPWGRLCGHAITEQSVVSTRGQCREDQAICRPQCPEPIHYFNPASLRAFAMLALSS